MLKLRMSIFAEPMVQRVSTGIEVTGDVLRLNPRLPEELNRLDMRIRYRGHSLDLWLTRDALTVRCREPGVAQIRLGFKDEIYELTGDSTQVFKLGRPQPCGDSTPLTGSVPR
jgi:trehalose/maltose hydrolase-like predicted phosphorylase